MREIKFRAWDKQKKVLGIATDIDFERKNVWFKWYASATRQGHYILLWDEVELMQFTGLKDKNGKEIYEGDILEHGNIRFEGKNYVPDIGSPYECIYHQNFFGFRSINKKSNIWGFPIPEDGKNTYFKVIGNIYENPELIK